MFKCCYEESRHWCNLEVHDALQLYWICSEAAAAEARGSKHRRGVLLSVIAACILLTSAAKNRSINHTHGEPSAGALHQPLQLLGPDPADSAWRR
jgi:hypothetical protein